MLEFKKTESDNCILVIDLINDCLITQLLQIDGLWGYQAFVRRITNADDLKKLADKLDELNDRVTLPMINKNIG